MHSLLEDIVDFTARFKFALLAAFSLLLLLKLHLSWEEPVNPRTLKGPDRLFESGYVANFSVYEGDGTLYSPTKPALIAAARATEDVTWAKELVDEYEMAH